MRIALFFNLPSGGAKRAVFEWTRRLVQRHQIDVYTLEEADHDFCDIRPFVQAYRTYPFTTHRLFASPIGRLNALQRTRDLHALTRLHRKIAADIEAGEYALVFANSDRFTFIPILLQFLRTPSLYYLHEPFGRTMQRSYKRPYINPLPRQKLLNKIDPLLALYRSTLNQTRARSVAATTRLIANSEFTRSHILATYNVDAPVCHYGVDSVNFFPQPEMPKEHLVVSVGEMGARKGFDFLIESLARIPPDQRPKLELASNYVREEELIFIQNLAARMNVHLQIHTNQNVEQLRSLFNRARLCVYSPYSEPFGLVPLEAMACGTPVLGVAEGGVKETVRDGETGLLTPRDPQLFADAMLELLGDEDRLAQMGARGRAYVTDCWTWEQSVQRLEDHFASVVAGSSLPENK